MAAKKFPLPDFESCSVALFASLLFMGPLPSRAQQPAAPRPPLTSSGLAAPAAEMARPRLVRHLDRLDGDKDGSISSAAFDESLK